MKKYLALLTIGIQVLSLSAPAFASSGRILEADVIHGLGNALKNPSFERATYDVSWTYTTITRNSTPETSTIAPGSGRQAEKLTFTAQAGNVAQSQVPNWNTVNVLMEASCKVNTTLGTVQVCGLANGVEQNCQSVSGSGAWTYVPATFSGPANGTSIGVEVKTTASTTGTVYVDDCYAGPSRNTGTINVPLAPQVTVLTSGSGTYTVPTNPSPSYIEFRMVGGGGGGGASATSGTANSGSGGGNTIFGGTTANSGGGGSVGNGGGGGGAGSGGSGYTIGAGVTPITTLMGSNGGAGSNNISTNMAGGIGGTSYYGGSSGGSYAAGTGGAAMPNSGSGGGGAGSAVTSASSGGGGGAGAFVDAIITNTSTAWASTYSYTVGAAGTGGAVSGGNGVAGGAGAAGRIEVIAYFQPQSTNVYSAANGGLAVGDVTYTSAASCAVGTVAADGTSRNTGVYPQLEAAYWNGSTFLYGGTGTLSSGTWKTPDLRGIFVRGSGTSGTLSNANGVAFSATEGTYQNDQFQSHVHYRGRSGNVGGIDASSADGVSNDYSVATGTPQNDGTNGAVRTGADTHPANLALLACVRTVPASAAPVIIGSSNSYINATAKTASYTLGANDSTVKFDATSGGLTATLPSAAGIQGQIYTIKKTDATGNTLTVATTSSQTMDTRTTLALTNYGDYAQVQSDGTNWAILSKKETSVLTATGSHSGIASGVSNYFASGGAALTLGPGTWRVTGLYSATATAAGSGVNITLTGGSGLYAADGANNSTSPTGISGSGFALLGNWNSSIQGGGNTVMGPNIAYTGSPVTVTLASTTTIYAVAQVNTTGSGANLFTGISAERVW